MRPEVKLIGEDGNAFAVLGKCSKAWREAGLPKEEWEKIRTEMMAGDYDHLLGTAMNHFDVI